MPGYVLFPTNCRLACGDLDHHLIHSFLCQPESTTQIASRSVQPFCTAQGRESLYFTTGRPYPLKFPLPIGDLKAHLTHSWRHSQPRQHLDRLNRFCTAHDRASLYFTMGRPFPLKIAPSHEGIPHLTHESLGVSEPTTQTVSRMDQPFLHSSAQSVPILYNGPPLLVFAWLTTVTDRPTYQAIWSVTIGRIYVQGAA